MLIQARGDATRGQSGVMCLGGLELVATSRAVTLSSCISAAAPACGWPAWGPGCKTEGHPHVVM
jgi:hypothetical protein